MFGVVRSVRDRGVAVLFVSHHIDEVFTLCDKVTVLRDGRHIVTRPVEGLDEDALIALMIGRKLEQFDMPESAPETHGEMVLQVRGLRTGVLQGVDLDVQAGEVIGIAGITGSGREEIALALFGGIPRQGEVTVAGNLVQPYRPDKAVDAGLGLVPAERHANAAFLESIAAGERLDRRAHVTFCAAGCSAGAERRPRSTPWLQKLESQAAGAGTGSRDVVRWEPAEGRCSPAGCGRSPPVLVLDEPTQGVDVGAKADIHALVEEAASRGCAPSWSSPRPQRADPARRAVLVLRGGRVADELRRPHIDPDRITAATIGAGKGAAA